MLAPLHFNFAAIDFGGNRSRRSSKDVRYDTAQVKFCVLVHNSFEYNANVGTKKDAQLLESAGGASNVPHNHVDNDETGISYPRLPNYY